MISVIGLASLSLTVGVSCSNFSVAFFSSFERSFSRCSNEFSFVFRSSWLISSNIVVMPSMAPSATSIRRTIFMVCHISPAAVVLLWLSLCKSRACWTISTFVGTAPRASILASKIEIFLSSWKTLWAGKSRRLFRWISVLLVPADERLLAFVVAETLLAWGEGLLLLAVKTEECLIRGEADFCFISCFLSFSPVPPDCCLTSSFLSFTSVLSVCCFVSSFSSVTGVCCVVSSLSSISPVMSVTCFSLSSFSALFTSLWLLSSSFSATGTAVSSIPLSFPLTSLDCLSSTDSLKLLCPTNWYCDLWALNNLISSKAACTAMSSVMSICFLVSEKCFTNSNRKRWRRFKLTAPISGVPKAKLRRSKMVTVASSLILKYIQCAC